MQSLKSQGPNYKIHLLTPIIALGLFSRLLPRDSEASLRGFKSQLGPLPAVCLWVPLPNFSVPGSRVGVGVSIHCKAEVIIVPIPKVSVKTEWVQIAKCSEQCWAWSESSIGVNIPQVLVYSLLTYLLTDSLTYSTHRSHTPSSLVICGAIPVPRPSTLAF